MKKAFIVGGSDGLGLEISKRFLNSPDIQPVVLSRNKGKLTTLKGDFIHEKCDLLKFSSDDFLNLFNEHFPISSICFSQRYRSNLKNTDNLFNTEEYIVMVQSIANALIAINSMKDDMPTKKEKDFLRIVVIGSTYAEGIGLDQQWSYHSCKAAQLSLVKYFSLNSNSKYNINMLSPATFIKNGAENYWKKQTKNKIWENYHIKRLATVKEIANSAFNLLTLSSRYINGNNILVDGGINNLYNDQII